MKARIFSLMLLTFLLFILLTASCAAAENRNAVNMIEDFFKNFFNSFKGSITGQVSIGGYCSSTSDCENGVCINSKCCKVDAQGNAIIPYICYPEEPTTKKANGESCSSDRECSSDNCDCVGPSCYTHICCPSGVYCCAVDSDCGVGMVCKNQDCFKKDGMPCESGSKCASGNCGHSICCAAGKHCCDSRDDCEDVGSGYQCSANYYCVKESTSPSEQPTSKKADGESCSEDVECESNWCDSGYCCKVRYKTCCRTDDECRKIFTAIPEIICNADYYCYYEATKAKTTVGKKQLCQECSNDAECASGWCTLYSYGFEASKYQCASPSGGTTCCPDGHYIQNFKDKVDCCDDGGWCSAGAKCVNYKCQSPSQETQETGFPEKADICEECSASYDCKSGYCVTLSSGKKACAINDILPCCSDTDCYGTKTKCINNKCECADNECGKPAINLPGIKSAVLNLDYSNDNYDDKESKEIYDLSRSGISIQGPDGIYHPLGDIVDITAKNEGPNKDGWTPHEFDIMDYMDKTGKTYYFMWQWKDGADTGHVKNFRIVINDKDVYYDDKRGKELKDAYDGAGKAGSGGDVVLHEVTIPLYTESGATKKGFFAAIGSFFKSLFSKSKSKGNDSISKTEEAPEKEKTGAIKIISSIEPADNAEAMELKKEIEEKIYPAIIEIFDNNSLWYTGPRSKENEIRLKMTSKEGEAEWNEKTGTMTIPYAANYQGIGNYNSKTVQLNAIAHELTHYHFNGIALANDGDYKKVPLWFREGIAEYGAHKYYENYLKTASNPAYSISRKKENSFTYYLTEKQYNYKETVEKNTIDKVSWTSMGDMNKKLENYDHIYYGAAFNFVDVTQKGNDEIKQNYAYASRSKVIIEGTIDNIKYYGEEEIKNKWFEYLDNKYSIEKMLDSEPTGIGYRIKKLFG